MGKATSFLYLNEEEMIRAGVLDSAHGIAPEVKKLEELIVCDLFQGKADAFAKEMGLGTELKLWDSPYLN